MSQSELEGLIGRLRVAYKSADRNLPGPWVYSCSIAPKGGDGLGRW